MNTTVIVLENPSKWDFKIEGVEIVKGIDYLTDPAFLNRKRLKILNLCKSYSYQSTGYYVSLVAAARGHYPVPSVKSMLDFRYNIIIKKVSDEIDNLIQKSLSRINSSSFELSIYFGKNVASCHSRLSKMLFNHFPLPLFRAYFKKHNKKWQLYNIKMISPEEVPESHYQFLKERIVDYAGRKYKRNSVDSNLYRYKLSVLNSPEEELPPSDTAAVEKIIKSAERNGLYSQIITSDDFAEIDKYDALFIRDTTAVNHYTYRFARRGEKEGLVVIDDPVSILRCTNKIYLKEILEKNRIPCPSSIIITQSSAREIKNSIGFPCVVKIPDSSFSLGVHKFDTEEDFEQSRSELFKKSSLLLVQEFTPTEYDWRIGILNNEPIFVCKYFMAEKHWQIYNHKVSDAGMTECIEIEQTPPVVLKTALNAAKLVGDGLYGVDLKIVNKKAIVIEINDNPSIDSGIEDEVYGDLLYDTIIREFIRRMDKIHGK